MPRIKKENETERPFNVGLSELANWTRGHIKEEELKAFQLPDLIPTRRKPSYW